MKKLILIFLLLLFGSSIAINNYFTPDYQNVNVVLETEWNAGDKINNVDVVIITENTNTSLVLMKQKQKLSEITLIKGVTVKIYSNNKLIKIFTH